MISRRYDACSGRRLTRWAQEIIYLENLPPHPNVIKYLFHMQTTNCLRLFVQRYPQNLRQYLVERSSPPKVRPAILALFDGG